MRVPLPFAPVLFFCGGVQSGVSLCVFVEACKAAFFYLSPSRMPFFPPNGETKERQPLMQRGGLRSQIIPYHSADNSIPEATRRAAVVRAQR